MPHRVQPGNESKEWHQQAPLLREKEQEVLPQVGAPSRVVFMVAQVCFVVVCWFVFDWLLTFFTELQLGWRSRIQEAFSLTAEQILGNKGKRFFCVLLNCNNTLLQYGLILLSTIAETIMLKITTPSSRMLPRLIWGKRLWRLCWAQRDDSIGGDLLLSMFFCFYCQFWSLLFEQLWLRQELARAKCWARIWRAYGSKCQVSVFVLFLFWYAWTFVRVVPFYEVRNERGYLVAQKVIFVLCVCALNDNFFYFRFFIQESKKILKPHLTRFLRNMRLLRHLTTKMLLLNARYMFLSVMFYHNWHIF